MTVYAAPGTEGSVVTYRSRYDHWIGGEWVPPVKGQYFENPSPVTGRTFCEVARGTAEDIEAALDAAHAAAPAWGKTSPSERANVLNKVADRIEANLEMLAVGETWDNGKAVRETLAADLPLAVDHFRYFAGVLRAQEGSISQVDDDTGKPLASSSRIRKIAFTGETTTGRLIMQYASQNLIPVTLELGGKSPNIFFGDVTQTEDAFYDKALEGFAMFALNQGEVCTCPSRALIQNSIIDAFLPAATERVKKIQQGNPLDTDTMMGAQASNDQLEKILSYIQIGAEEGARIITGGERVDLGGDLSGGYYVAPTIFQGHNKMRIFQEEIFGPVVAVTGFDDYADAIEIANDTLYGLGAGVWSRDVNTAYRAGRDIQAGRVWTNCYHAYPAHAAFGGYKGSGIGRENHAMMLDHYQQTKNLLVSYSPNALGFF